MTAANQEETGGLAEPRMIRPGPDVEKPLNVEADAREKRRRLPSPTERYEARVDLHIAGLQEDKERLEAEVLRLRDQELHHLREEVRGLDRELVKVRTLYASAIAFNWFSFALIATGGCVVSYATFLHPAAQMTIATLGLFALFIGVIVQAFNSWAGTRLSRGTIDLQRGDPGAAGPPYTPISTRGPERT